MLLNTITDLPPDLLEPLQEFAGKVKQLKATKNEIKNIIGDDNNNFASRNNDNHRLLTNADNGLVVENSLSSIHQRLAELKNILSDQNEFNHLPQLHNCYINLSLIHDIGRLVFETQQQRHPVAVQLQKEFNFIKPLSISNCCVQTQIAKKLNNIEQLLEDAREIATDPHSSKRHHSRKDNPHRNQYSNEHMDELLCNIDRKIGHLHENIAIIKMNVEELEEETAITSLDDQNDLGFEKSLEKGKDPTIYPVQAPVPVVGTNSYHQMAASFLPNDGDLKTNDRGTNASFARLLRCKQRQNSYWHQFGVKLKEARRPRYSLNAFQELFDDDEEENEEEEFEFEETERAKTEQLRVQERLNANTDDTSPLLSK